MMTPEEFKKRMQEAAALEYEEVAHPDADGVMCDLLRELGYGDGVDVFEAMPKWYA